MVKVGLVEGRFAVCTFDDQFSVAEVARMRSDIIEMFSQTPGKVVMLSDLARVTTLAPAVRAPLVSVLQTDNPRIERNAILVTRGTPFVMQAHNVVRDADSRVRRVFTDRAEVEAWLGELLTPAERAALKTALGT